MTIASMGNSQIGVLKNAIVENNEEDVKGFIANQQTRPLLEQKLNRKGDTAIVFCARHGRLNLIELLVNAGCNLKAVNHDNKNALDVSLQALLPDDGNILHHHFCPYSCAESEHTFEFTDLIRYLLRKGVTGQFLNRLILFAMNNDNVIKELIDLLPDLTSTDYRIVGLLLQVTVWYEQYGNLLMLLQGGANIDDFWRATFMPTIRPSQSFQHAPWPLEDEYEGEYEVTLPADSDAIQNLKLAFIQDWRADWNDGENPNAQFRAGLQLTPDGAVYFIRASSSRWLMSQIIADVNKYLPKSCSGPDLRNSRLIDYMITADYPFSVEECTHVQLKFGIEFKEYEDYRNSVRSLRHLCRAVIRASCHLNVFYAMKRLKNVPNTLKDYLTISTPLV